MTRLLRPFFGAALALAVALPAVATTPSEFYLSMLRRGVGAYDAGRFEAAVSPLKIAAFGLVDSIEHYQTAHAHLALTYDRLGDAENAREAARRVVIAERIEPKFRSLPLPAATRANYQVLARRLLTPADLAILERSPGSVIVPVEPVKPDPVKADPPVPLSPRSQAPARATRPPASFAAAEVALEAWRLKDAQAIYRELLDSPSLERSDLLRVAEGFYRSRDFANALRAFERIGPLRAGEDHYRYYIAVALYETGHSRRANDELAAALPFIEETPDVTQYREKIEAAVR